MTNSTDKEPDVSQEYTLVINERQRRIIHQAFKDAKGVPDMTDFDEYELLLQMFANLAFVEENEGPGCIHGLCH